MMASSLVPLPTLSPSPKKNIKLIPATPGNKASLRREFMHGLLSVGLVSSSTVESANAAARRPPPPPPEEKKDPSITGLRAKILANKKRKEAMKEEVAKLREKGKPVN
ncbi:uncharacterized protein A4U43_C10F14390 [Asparagus officinalis]|uniref:Uncharacterized protein n=1 Tax=Asparagus officinalis TaxID=4686 RepID=A0A5P1E615_ASPOF|nr:uncharacterized protein LOC109825570 [Asparagus officinalis]ONK56895.1 uncharacterized protein A4U43_C10F14390 [Asparagus officinalis]